MYKEVALNCFRYLGFRSFDEVDKLEIDEYLLLMKAVRYKQVDEACKLHLQAFLNFSVRARKKNGKPVYSKFDKFFNYKKKIEELEHKASDKFSALSKHMKEKRGG